jgi:hypothetical protein
MQRNNLFNRRRGRPYRLFMLAPSYRLLMRLRAITIRHWLPDRLSVIITPGAKMLPWLWKFLHDGRNRAILSWLGGGAVVIATGIWAAIVYFFPAHKPPELNPRDVQANCGGVAIGGNVSGTTITGGATTSSDCSTKPKPAP